MNFGAEDRKQLHDSSWIVACLWTNNECYSLYTCLAISNLAHTSLVISGGAILASNYESSTLVGFWYPVIALQFWLRSRCSRCACLDLYHTVVAYSEIK